MGVADLIGKRNVQVMSVSVVYGLIQIIISINVLLIYIKKG